MNSKAHAYAIVGILAWLGMFHLWANGLTRAPLDMPISLDPAQQIDMPVHLPLAETYDLSFAFTIGSHSREEMRRLLGEPGRSPPPGTGIPLEWSLTTSGSGTRSAAGGGEVFGHSGFSAEAYYRSIANIKVLPGDYVLHLQILREVSDFTDIPTRLRLALRPKAVSTWQTDVIFWGSLVNVFVLPLLLFCLTASLIWKIVRRASATARS